MRKVIGRLLLLSFLMITTIGTHINGQQGPTIKTTIQAIKTNVPKGIKQPESSSYWAQLKAKMAQQFQPFYTWYEKHKTVIKPVAQSVVAAGLGKFLHDYIDKGVRESYRIKSAREGQAYLQEPGTPNTALGTSGSSLPFNLVRSDTGELFRTGLASKKEMDERYNINMPEDLYQRWLDYSVNMGKESRKRNMEKK